MQGHTRTEKKKTESDIQIKQEHREICSSWKRDADIRGRTPDAEIVRQITKRQAMVRAPYRQGEGGTQLVVRWFWSSSSFLFEASLIWVNTAELAVTGEGYRKKTELDPLEARGDEELYQLDLWFTVCHVDVFAPPTTDPQPTNPMLSLTQSVDPCRGP